jgi:glutamyl-tRNA synthetase
MKFTRGNAVVTYDKLLYLQKAHATRYATSETTDHGSKISLITEPILKVLKERGWVSHENLILGRHDAETYLVKLVKLDSRNYTTAQGFVDRNKYFFQRPDRDTLLQFLVGGLGHLEPSKSGSSGWAAHAKGPVLSTLEPIQPEAWTTENIHNRIKAVIAQKAEESMNALQDGASDLDVEKKDAQSSWTKSIHRYIRWVVSAGLPGPDTAATMQILGKDETLARFTNAANILETFDFPGGLNEDRNTKGLAAHGSPQ